MKRAVVLAVVVMMVWAAPAFAAFNSTASASTIVSAHQLGTPTLSCGSINVLNVTFNWTAPADATQADVYGSGNLVTGYEVLRGTTSGGPYPTLVATVTPATTTTYTATVVAGTFYFVVRTIKQMWKGPFSNQRKVTALLVATCS